MFDMEGNSSGPARISLGFALWYCFYVSGADGVWAEGIP